MSILITIVHVFAAIFLITVVLLQSGKGAELGAAFGGASQTIFGSSGTVTLLGRVTAVLAIVFMITSLSLTVISSSKTVSVMPEAAKPKNVKPQEAKLPVSEEPVKK